MMLRIGTISWLISSALRHVKRSLRLREKSQFDGANRRGIPGTMMRGQITG
jgi:hypothetical protein